MPTKGGEGVPLGEEVHVSILAFYILDITVCGHKIYPQCFHFRIRAHVH